MRGWDKMPISRLEASSFTRAHPSYVAYPAQGLLSRKNSHLFQFPAQSWLRQRQCGIELLQVQIVRDMQRRHPLSLSFSESRSTLESECDVPWACQCEVISNLAFHFWRRLLVPKLGGDRELRYIEHHISSSRFNWMQRDGWGRFRQM